MSKTFFSYSFGCRVNHAEMQDISSKMIKAGFSHTLSHPDIYIINSCAVTHKAEREVRNHIYQVNKKYPKTKIVLTGCAGTYWSLKKDRVKLPVALIILNKNKQNLVKEILKKHG